jgi:protein TonB
VRLPRPLRAARPVPEATPPPPAPRPAGALELPRLLEEDPGATVRYPTRARRLGFEGTVTLLVHVRADGTVARVDVAESSGHDELDRAAAEAAARWRFEPARRDGRPVAHDARVPVEFKLADA